MYVSDRDVSVLNDLLGLVQQAIEGGAEDQVYWQSLSKDSIKLFNKLKKQRDRLALNREVKKIIKKHQDCFE